MSICLMEREISFLVGPLDTGEESALAGVIIPGESDLYLVLLAVDPIYQRNQLGFQYPVDAAI